MRLRVSVRAPDEGARMAANDDRESGSKDGGACCEKCARWRKNVGLALLEISAAFDRSEHTGARSIPLFGTVAGSRAPACVHSPPKSLRALLPKTLVPKCTSEPIAQLLCCRGAYTSFLSIAKRVRPMARTGSAD